MRVVLIFIFIFLNLSAAGARKSDIAMILEVMRENNKNIIKIMQENNKRLEEKFTYLEKEIKATKSQIKAVKSELQNQIKGVKNELQSQIKGVKEDLQNQIKAIDRRIDDIYNLMLGLLAGIFALIGFMWWDRRTMIAKAKEEMREIVEVKVANKADNRILEKVVLVLKELASKNKEFEDIIRKYDLHLIYEKV